MSQREPKVSQRGPKVSQREPKVSQKDAKGSQREPKGSQKRAISEPKGDQNASKNQPSEKVAKREPKRSPHKTEMGGFWEPFSIKNRWKKRCENRCLKSHEFHEKTMRKFNVFWIEILRKIGCVRKVPNANKPIKTNGFLMISWFARFKNRFGKLQKKHEKRCRKSDAKNIGKSSNKSSKIDAKTIKKP